MDKTFGRGQKLHSVIQSIPQKESEYLQDQLFKISANEYNNEFIEKFHRERIIIKQEGTYASILKGEKSQHPNDSQKEVDVKFDMAGFPSLGPNPLNQPDSGTSTKSSASESDDNEESYVVNSKPVSNSSEFKTAVTLPSRNRKGIGRGQRLRMVTESIPGHTETLQFDIERACGTDYTNPSIEHFVKTLTERNDEEF